MASQERILTLSLALLAATAVLAHAATSPTVFVDNGGWCWYQDERVVIDKNLLIIGSVAEAAGAGGAARDGDVQVTGYDLSTNTSLGTTVLHDSLNSDDHAAPAFLVRPDGRILTVYVAHNGTSKYSRVSTAPGNLGAWQPEQIYTEAAGMCYSNVFRLNSEGTTYDFYRGVNKNPNFLVSSNDGTTWSYGGRLINWGSGGTGATWCYVKYASNNSDEIHFLYTQGHPEFTITNIYHAYIKGGNVYRSDGTLIKGLYDGGIVPSQGTLVFAGDAGHLPWTTDLHLDSAGRPFTVYSVHLTNDDHRYRYARWNGSQWIDHEIAYAGQNLYADELDYTGLVTVDPNDPNTVYISTNADPVAGTPLISSADGLRHWEVFRGFTNDGGATWSWTPVTENSTVDNLRPTVPIWDSQHTALLWLRGTYYTYRSYDLEVVGHLLAGANGCWTNTAGGSWASPGNWNDGRIAGGTFSIADFTTADLSGNAIVTLDGSRTLGFLSFGDTNTASPGQWTLAPGSGGTLTLASEGVAPPTIRVLNGSATIGVSLAGSQGLIVEGPGTLILDAANTYSGDTMIASGTLSTTSAFCLDDGADLWIAAGAMIDLDFLGGDSIAGLFLDGVAQAVGTWGATGSGAAYVNDDYFSGTGVLIVALIPGDTDGDSDVDAMDAAVLAANWGLFDEMFDYRDGDFNGDHRVNAADAAILTANWGYNANEAGGAVPEPSTLGLILAAASLLALRRR